MASVIPDNHSPLLGVEAALRRAAQRARELARQTHTPLVIYRNGKIERRTVPDVSAPAVQNQLHRD
jgi:hypothetical protein